LIAVDTSVVVAAFASWHAGHRAARAVLERRPRLPAHVAVEAYSVLTRLPPPHRAAPDVAEAFVSARFPLPFLTLSDRAFRRLLADAVRRRITGGAIYDALVAAIALEAGAVLLSRDLRAARTYEAMGARFQLVG
jgi:predicted nucleic acid-binding protein